MAFSPENPFANYQPPTGQDVFSPEGKALIVQFKMENLATAIKTWLDPDDRAELFASGTLMVSSRYDYGRLHPYLSDGDVNVFELILEAVEYGVQDSLAENELKLGDDKSIFIRAQFDDQEPGMINIEAAVIEDKLEDQLEYEQD